METETVNPTTTTTAPPYFAFKTLLNTLDQMKEKAIPSRVDRSYLVGMSGAGQTQFIAGLKSLGLIDGNGTVQPRLTELVKASPTERKRILGAVLTERYPEAVELGKTNATTAQLVEVFRDYGVQGDTARKAIAFYLNAARYVGDIPLSAHFSTPKVTASPGTKKKKAPARNGSDEIQVRHGDHRGSTFDEYHPAIAGVLSELPTKGKTWTKTRRDTWLATFTTVMDFGIKIVDEGEPEDEEPEEEADELDETE